MPYHDAMSNHIIWKRRLQKAVDGPYDERFAVAVVARDDVCELGKWIYGDGLKYSSSTAYQKVVRAHAAFHLYAADVLLKLGEGDKAAAKEVLDDPLEAKSREIISAIVDLRAEFPKF